MSFHVLIMNGPPLVGKDTLALYAQSLNPQSRHVKLSSRLKLSVATLFDYPIELMETGKVDPQYIKYGKTIRDHQIALSESIKSVYGNDIYGRLLADRLLSMPMQTPYVIVSDLRLHEEFLPIVQALGAKRITLLRLHQEGREWEAGTSFRYIEPGDSGVRTFY